MATSIINGTLLNQDILLSNVGGITNKSSIATETTNINHTVVPDSMGNNYQFILGSVSSTPSSNTNLYPGNALVIGDVVVNPEFRKDSSGNNVTSDISVISGNINLAGYKSAGISDDSTGNLLLEKTGAKIALGSTSLTTSAPILLDSSSNSIFLNDISGNGIALNGTSSSILLGTTANKITVNGTTGNVLLNKYSSVNGIGVPSTFLPNTDTSGNAITFDTDSFPALGLTPGSSAPRSYVDSAISDLYNNLVGTAPSTLNTLQELASALTDGSGSLPALNAALNNKYDKTGGLITGSTQISQNLDISGNTVMYGTLTVNNDTSTNSLHSIDSYFGNSNQATIDISGNLFAPHINSNLINAGPNIILDSGNNSITSDILNTAFLNVTGNSQFGNNKQLKTDISGNLITSGSLTSTSLFVTDLSGINIVDIVGGPSEHLAFRYNVEAYNGINVSQGLNVLTGNLAVTDTSTNNVTFNPPTYINNTLNVTSAITGTNNLDISGNTFLRSGLQVEGGDVSLLGSTSDKKVYVGLQNAMNIPSGYQLTTPDISKEIVSQGVRYIPDNLGNASIIFGTSWKFLLSSDLDSSGNPTNASLKVQYSNNNNSVWNTVATFLHS